MTNRRSFLSSLAGLVVGGAATAIPPNEITPMDKKMEAHTIVIRVDATPDHVRRVVLADFDSEHSRKLRDIITRSI